ncbi:hypothetical protein NSK_000345 [Nannochloropsis salina CCMP1776]|uniref:Thioredoxin-like fold domain-containing protein n=1 Tax=Nannochloropsis salina CCMP1776 TaxID=1027361 RepID=A0A4D9D8H0_9STRA|nr:hypothetical protein NSK_000345 [Nannochloropsis salina CCMP1776]|eukprot:TFJ87991.1 hypothetical protein NSK_000345 [Nannochloropsis salina CCMP1776]
MPPGAAAAPALIAPKVVVEVFLDLNCPPSRRCFKTLYEGGIIEAYKDKPVQILFHNVIQPWHAVGAWMHEAALAVKDLQPSAFYPYANKVFDAMERFSDVNTEEMTRKEVMAALIALGVEAGVPRPALEERLALQGGSSGNKGTATTQAVKWACKYHRRRGVHVTPTVFVNGLEASEVSSAWGVEEWKGLLDECLEAR